MADEVWGGLRLLATITKPIKISKTKKARSSRRKGDEEGPKRKKRKTEATAESEEGGGASSSAEERVKKRRNRKPSTRRKPGPPPAELPFELQAPVIEVAHQALTDAAGAVIKIESAVDLLKRAPHLDVDMTSAARCLGLSDAKKAEAKIALERLHAEDPGRNPALGPVFNDFIKSIPVPDLNLQIYQGKRIPPDQMIEQMRKGNIVLSLQRAELESELLCEAGRFQMADGNWRNFPPCANGEERCITFTVSRLWCSWEHATPSSWRPRFKSGLRQYFPPVAQLVECGSRWFEPILVFGTRS